MSEKKLPPSFETMDQAIEAASKYISQGHTLIISIEKYRYNVSLELPLSKEMEINTGKGMLSDIHEALKESLCQHSIDLKHW